MSISFKKLGLLLKSNNKTFYSLRKDKIVGTETTKKLQNGTGYIDTRTINNLCGYLNCQPGDLMEYVPDKKHEEIKSAAGNAGESVNGCIKKAIDERMERDSQ